MTHLVEVGESCSMSQYDELRTQNRYVTHPLTYIYIYVYIYIYIYI